MSGLNNLSTRLKYRGGDRQRDRMIEDKLKSLKKALDYSYQAATAQLQDGREFRCLINPNKLAPELDDKILSIPFKDFPLNQEKEEDIGVKCGDVILWKETNTHWIVYSQYLQEIAYFRGQMRQCEKDPIEINGQQFWYYLQGPSEKSIDWQKSKRFIFNELNYTVEIYISNTSVTSEFFHRFKKCKIQGKNFEVQAVDDLTIDGILTVYLKEDYTNQWEEEPAPIEKEENLGSVYISGPKRVYPYEEHIYSIVGANGGSWALNNEKAKILSESDTAISIQVVTGKSGSFTIFYTSENAEQLSLDVEILSL